MKKPMFLVLTALLMFNCVPAFAQDAPEDQYRCKLEAGTCLKKVDAVQRKMKKMEAEVKKGKTTYSAEELKKIEDKLNEVEKMLDELKAK